MRICVRFTAWALAGLGLVPVVLGQEPAPGPAAAQTKTQPSLPLAKSQPRPHGQRVTVGPAAVTVDDGDTVIIHWPSGDVETVRILGIDTPETRHLDHNVPFDQALGPESRTIAQGAFAAASEIELLRCPTLDPYARTLAYLFINKRNYSVLVIKARLATETISHYGDNGLPKEAAAVVAAAKDVGPLPFEPPYQFRARMRDLTTWLKQNGQYPAN